MHDFIKTHLYLRTIIDIVTPTQNVDLSSSPDKFKKV